MPVLCSMNKLFSILVKFLYFCGVVACYWLVVCRLSFDVVCCLWFVVVVVVVVVVLDCERQDIIYLSAPLIRLR